ncbi:putative Flavonol synthase/flavanone 3-hydroxylase [Cocos nucifera]|uniref:Putative Flavonol synthase/flavanone 3-hydroxylase n=1 Tax=Cocos nucifera TaxID=13894 RepID=A0A8K0ISR4_COCNU|nr:putative Flavonol synthase/flavanone 3-hydroxylase [Cocos nucifera]KAG1366642.1 putative Flavonol synthase/flavanone 3-hydroxylase [Cocos nucifera]
MEVERVQVIASQSKALDTIPSEFIRSEHERPGTTTFHGPVPEIPVVDLAEPDRDRVVQAVVKAGQEWGIFQVVNHGIPVEVIKELQRVGKEFFELPQEEKEAYAMKPESETLEGYGTKLQKDLEGKKAWVDFFFHNIWPQSRLDHSIWPKNPASYRFEFSWILQ